jgi:hypothetical protein
LPPLEPSATQSFKDVVIRRTAGENHSLSYVGGGHCTVESPNEVIAAIRAAFAGVTRGAITLHEAEVIDSYGSHAERAAARRLDTEASWDQVPDADIRECSNALCYLDPESSRYYIPAYMVWSLRYYRATNSIVPNFTIYSLSPSIDSPGLEEHKLERFRLLDVAQSRAVCRFLRYMAANDDYADAEMATLGLTEYWGKFCTDPDTTPGTPVPGADDE